MCPLVFEHPMHEDFVHKILEDFVHGMLEHVLLIVAPGDHIQMVRVLDVLDPVCEYTSISVEMKTWTIDFAASQY
jgi:hypothetical protein